MDPGVPSRDANPELAEKVKLFEKITFLRSKGWAGYPKAPSPLEGPRAARNGLLSLQPRAATGYAGDAARGRAQSSS
jgi:hypothetical protein